MISNFWNKLPNNLVWTYNQCETPLCKDDDLMLPILVYLNECKNSRGLVQFTLEDLIISCGLKVNTNKGKSVEQFKKRLSQIQTYGWLDKNVSFENLKPKEFIKCEFKITYDKDKEDNDTHFFPLRSDNFHIIMNCDTKLDKIKLLKTYCYCLARMGKNNSEQLENLKYYNGCDTKINSFYDTYGKICEDLNISDKSFTQYLKLLKELELIFSGNIGLVKNKEGQTYMANNIYTCCKSDLKRALACSKEYYIENGYKIIGKKNSTKHRQSNGIKCNITKEENKGKDVHELIEKLNDINNMDVFK